MARETPQRRLRFLPKQGYLMLLVGILLGFLIFSAISFMFPATSQEGGVGQEGFPASIDFVFLYTSEKQGWIEEVKPDFEQWFFDRFNISVNVELVVTGSHRSVNFILRGEQPVAWSPASSIWIPYLNFKWRGLGNDGDVAEDWTPLVLSPVVIAAWNSFLQAHNVTGFRDLNVLAAEGFPYKYGHPDPLLSNGGAMTVILEFAEAASKTPEQLTADDFKDQAVLDFVRDIEFRAVRYGASTGFFGRWAAENGPLEIDCFSVYESVVLANSLKARNKWGDPLVAVYPSSGTLLSDHPFVILNASWVSKWQKFAATQFLLYLLESQAQEKAQRHGFRPANPSVPLDVSVFSEENGVKLDIRVPVLKPLPGEAMETLFTVWPEVKNPG